MLAVLESNLQLFQLSTLSTMPKNNFQMWTNLERYHYFVPPPHLMVVWSDAGDDDYVLLAALERKSEGSCWFSRKQKQSTQFSSLTWQKTMYRYSMKNQITWKLGLVKFEAWPSFPPEKVPGKYPPGKRLRWLFQPPGRSWSGGRPKNMKRKSLLCNRKALQ